MQDVLQALAAPRRQEVVRLLGNRELSAGEIAEHFTLTRQAVSQHLQVLKRAGLLAERRDGARRLYRLSPGRIAELDAFLDSLWAGGLARLKQAAEDSEQPTRRPGRN